MSAGKRSDSHQHVGLICGDCAILPDGQKCDHCLLCDARRQRDELLAALKAIAGECETCEGRGTTFIGGALNGYVPCIRCGKARAAIAKAEGSTHG